MKFFCLAVLFLSIVFAGPLAAMELEISAGAGNITFDPKLNEYLGLESDPKPFEPRFFPIGKAAISTEVGFVYLEGGFERSPLLRNRLFANIGLDMTYFTMEVGPFVGLFNTSEEIFNPGLSIGMNLEFPGIIFLNAGASSSLGGTWGLIGSYTQKAGDISLGFWVPHVICSLNIQTQSFGHKKDTNLLVEDNLIRYFFRADVFAKNFPFTIMVDIGYGSLKRAYHTQTVSGSLEIESNVFEDELRYFFLGFRAAYTISQALTIFLSGEAPVHSWSVPPMRNPKQGSFLFQAQAGIVYTF